LADAQKILPTLHKYIEIYSERKHIRIFLDDIISIITDGHYLNIKLTDQTSVRCRMTMKEFIGCTDGDDRFIYANKGITLNADYIVDFKDNCCIMEDGTRLPIRVRERLQIEQAIQDYNFDKIRRRQCRYTATTGTGELL
ncbi:MAG: hypothetical protein HFH14_09270, partial [Lachnospiraceae bacterium]|nr:hypothetical protein [Lachnospiraceae bacterium]